MTKKYLLATVSGALLLTLGFFAFNAYIYNEKQVDENQNFEPYRAELEGRYVCLPLVNADEELTDECALGLKTDVGEYYSVDFALMSQTHDPLTVGQRFTAAGVVTPIERLSTDHWQKYGIEGIFSVTDSLVVKGDETEPMECNGDALICPDGSSVGRQGLRCEFAACPSPDATSSILTTYLGGTATGLTVSVTPKEVVSDSRCPENVTCVWAGTVEVRTVLATPVSHGEHVLTLGEPQAFGDYTVTLTGITPEKGEETIPESSYRFTYEVVKK